MNGAFVAALPVYDFPEVAAANNAIWGAIAAKLRARGNPAPERLAHEEDLPALWRNPHLLFAQTCGYPLIKDLRDSVVLIATPEYSFAGCAGALHRNFIICRAIELRRSLKAFRGAVAAVNVSTATAA